MDPVTPTPDHVETTPPTNVFDDISKETGKNYTDKDAVVNAIKEKDSFIEKLKEENRETRELVDTLATKVDESVNAQKVLEELTNRPKSADATPAQPVDTDTITNLFDELYSSKTKEVTTKSNLAEVNAKLTEAYGDKASETLKAKAVSLGLSPEEVKDLASKSPQSALTLLGLAGGAKQVDATPAPAGDGQYLPTPTASPYADFKVEMKARGLNITHPAFITELNKRNITIT